MSSNIQYSVVLPITNQSVYYENDVVDFIVNIPQGMEMRQNSIRINSRIQVKANNANLTPANEVYINPNVGAHGFFNNWNIEFNGGVQETITEYGRYISAKTEASKFYLDVGSDVSSLNELKGVSDVSDPYVAGYSSGTNMQNYFTLLGDSNGTYGGFCPFSIKPVICVNQSNAPISSDKIQTIKIKVQLEPAFKVLKCDNPLITSLSYTMQELNLTYLLQPKSNSESLVMERVMVQANNTVVGSMANLQNVTPAPFSKMFMTFKDTTHVNSSSSFQYDYYLNELLEDIQRLEFTVNSIDATYSYPLLSNDEIIYNYLLCFSPSLDKHSLNLAKLRNPVLASGFGVGTRFFSMIPENSAVSVDIDLSSAPTNPVQVFTFFMTAISV